MEDNIKLLITEKPSVAMEFAKALNLKTKRNDGYLESDEWIITWCVGHLVTMSYPEKYDEKLKKWRLDTLPFIPSSWKYEVISNTKKQFGIVKKLLQRKDIEVIYNAGDSGREGEYIQRLVFQEAKPNAKAKILRVWIDSQTNEEILRGINEAKEQKEYDSLADSAYLRAKEDYLIGINFSRLLSIKYGDQVAKQLNESFCQISVGRVMSCVLGMICFREIEIQNFKQTQFYKVLANYPNGMTFEWKVNEKSKFANHPKLYNDNGFLDKEVANELIQSVKGKQGKVTEFKKSNVKQNPPLLFNLAEIQNEATKQFKLKPDKTLDIIQSLYEKKLVTYPRTDARVLSTAVAKEISKNLNGLSKLNEENISEMVMKIKEEKYSIDLTKTKYVDDKKITDHYAIIPTGDIKNIGSLTELEKKIYFVIVKRFIAIFYPPAEFSKVNITVSYADDNVENFTFSQKVLKNIGYLSLYKNSEEVNEKDINVVNTIKKGSMLQTEDFELKESKTQPPNRYNSGSLILAMENAGKLIEDESLREQIKTTGIGTAATRGGIVKKLETIKYIEINSKTQIVKPTEKGMAVFKVIYATMKDLLNPKLTASWEKGLEMVAKSEISKDVFMEKLVGYINSKFK